MNGLEDDKFGAMMNLRDDVKVRLPNYVGKNWVNVKIYMQDGTEKMLYRSIEFDPNEADTMTMARVYGKKDFLRVESNK